MIGETLYAVFQMKETGSSRWRKYLDTPEAEPEDEEEDYVSLDRQQLRDNHMTDRYDC